MAGCCGCTQCQGTCCYTLINCVTSVNYLVNASGPTTQTACLDNNIGNIIRVFGSTIPDGCYRIVGCQAWDPESGLPDPCISAITLPVTCVFTTNPYTMCNDCVILRAIDCNNPGVIVYFHAAPSITISLIINKVIFASFVGYTERCWSISVVNSGTPITTLNTYNGPYNDCVTCQQSGGSCIDLLSTISGIDDRCNQKIGSATVIPTTGVAPFTYLWSNGQVTSTISNLSSGLYSVTFIDSLGCIGTNSIVLNNLPCNKNYLVTPCNTDIAPFYITNPVSSPNPNPDAYVGNIFFGSITLPTEELVQACYNLVTSTIAGVIGAFINVTTYSFNTCLECNPITYKVARCDDPNIFYYTNTDLSKEVDKVIKNVTFTGCDDTIIFPCSSLPEQCWNVTIAVSAIYPVTVTYDSLIFPDCDCCKPC